ncbi:MAG TPA: APC family permease [Vicinamibacterales bacterium]|nr:APC family permease [Vicinamibacterales bacterium]
MVEIQAPSVETSLRRSIGTFALAAGIVNVTIGGGIFRLPADMAATLGPTAPIAYLLCAVAMGLIVLCLAEAGSRVSMTGGPYAYVEVAFGPFVGFLAGILLWMLLTFAMAAVATVLTASLGALVPPLASRGASAAVLVAIYAAFAAINIMGVERGARVNTALTIAKIFPLLLLIAGGLFAIDADNVAIRNPPDMGTLARSSILLIFAFAGIEAALVPSGEVKDPASTVPRALLIAMVVITLLYAGLQFVAQGVLGPALATSKAAPLADAAGVALGGWARTLLLVGAVVSMLGHAGAMILATPRTLFAFARDGFLPGALARLHPVHRTPVAAIVVQCAIVLVLAITSTFERLAILANISILVLYGTCCLATWELRRRDVRTGGIPFRIPAPTVVIVLSALVIGWMLTSVTLAEWTAFGIGLGLACLIFLFRRKA